MVAANLQFLPWVRQGAAAGIATPDNFTPTLPARVALTASLDINGQPEVSRSVQLFGPADVLGIDLRQIVRMDPPPGSVAFEPNYFAAIEFDRPDFPWLFTPAAAGANGRLRPWLVLVVVKRQQGVTLRPAGDTPLPTLEITAPARPGDELPDLAESPLWAHAQAASGVALATALGERSELSLSRLLCPRLLQPDSDYTACLVPAFEPGRKAGLGDKAADGPLAPAWTQAQPQVMLPVYHHWDFHTGSGGDFESLVRLLEPREAPAGLGRRRVVVGTPGFVLPADFPQGSTLDIGAALEPIDAAPAPWPAGTQAVFQQALAEIVNAPGLQAASDDDPLLAPPLYGRWHAARATVDPAAPGDWLDELNLDPRHRAVAAYGTLVVQEHQEALMAAAWDQAGEVQRANQLLRQLQLSLFVGHSLHARHVQPLPDDALLRVAAPAFTRITTKNAGEVQAMTVGARLAGSTLPLKAASPAMRRLSATRGPIGRRIAVQGKATTGGFAMLTKLSVGVFSSFALPAPPTTVTVAAVRERLAQPGLVKFFAEVDANAVRNRSGRAEFVVFPEATPVPVPAFEILMLRPDNAAAAAFRAAAVAHLEALGAGRQGAGIAMKLPLEMAPLMTSLRTQTAPGAHIAALARARVAVAGKAVATPSAADTPSSADAAAAAAAVDPVMFAPQYRQPMYEALRDLSQQLLLPGLEAVAPNSVIGLQTNRRFVEAYLVGLNVEMGRELLWRGFPTDQRGTCFDRFWDSRGSAAPRPDVSPLHGWGRRRLGETGGAPQRERFVLLLRSELLRRYPTAAVYAVPAVMGAQGRSPSSDSAHELHPAFRGSLQPDLSFFGFDLSPDDMRGSGDHPGHYIVLQEQPSEPRFGFDVGTPFGERSHVHVAAGAPAGLGVAAPLQWGLNAAHMAGITRQLPVRIAIHASELM